MPSLVLAGAQDRVNTPATARQVASRIGAELEIFPDMSHWLLGEPGWQDVAARALDWLPAAGRAAA